MFLRRTAAFLLLLAFFGQAFSRYHLAADYYVNTSAYIANCVNKDRPWMHCNGRCQFCKKLHQQDNAEDKQTPERKSGNNWDESFYSVPRCIDFAALHFAVPVTRRFPEMCAASAVRMPRHLFHPPGNI